MSAGRLRCKRWVIAYLGSTWGGLRCEAQVVGSALTVWRDLGAMRGCWLGSPLVR